MTWKRDKDATRKCEGAGGELEASPGIEPGYTDLQSAASPLRHEAVSLSLYANRGFLTINY